MLTPVESNLSALFELVICTTTSIIYFWRLDKLEVIYNKVFPLYKLEVVIANKVFWLLIS